MVRRIWVAVAVGFAMALALSSAALAQELSDVQAKFEGWT